MSKRQQCEKLDPAGEEFARRMFAGTLHNIANIVTTTRLAVSDLEEAHSAENTAIVDAILDEFLPPLEAAVAERRAATFLAPGGPGAEYVASIRQLLEHQRTALAAQHESVESIRRKLMHISDIIVLQQRLLSGHAGPESVCVNETVDAALAMMEEMVRQQGVQVVRSFETDAEARADRAILTQVLINIIKNALEALSRIDDGSPRRLEIRTWTETDDEGVRICCRVADNGPGLPQDAIDSIFEYGYTTKLDSHESNGIGLHFCRQALARIDGNIEACSVSPRGAAFVITLPGDASIFTAVEG